MLSAADDPSLPQSVVDDTCSRAHNLENWQIIIGETQIPRQCVYDQQQSTVFLWEGEYLLNENR